MHTTTCKENVSLWKTFWKRTTSNHLKIKSYDKYKDVACFYCKNNAMSREIIKLWREGEPCEQQQNQ